MFCFDPQSGMLARGRYFQSKEHWVSAQMSKRSDPPHVRFLRREDEEGCAQRPKAKEVSPS